MSDPVKAPAHYDGAHGVACMDAMRNMLDRDLSGALVPMSAEAGRGVIGEQGRGLSVAAPFSCR